jgi:hypothetical protein
VKNITEKWLYLHDKGLITEEQKRKIHEVLFCPISTNWTYFPPPAPKGLLILFNIWCLEKVRPESRAQADGQRIVRTIKFAINTNRAVG